jgi:putative transposase
VEADPYFYTVVRYVERNALRANLVERAEQWRWSSLWQRRHAQGEIGRMLHGWPLPPPAEWLRLVNAAQSEAEVAAVRRAVLRGSPLGSARWQQRIAKRLGLESTLCARGRPKKKPKRRSAAVAFLSRQPTRKRAASRMALELS